MLASPNTLGRSLNVSFLQSLQATASQDQRKILLFRFYFVQKVLASRCAYVGHAIKPYVPDVRAVWQASTLPAIKNKCSFAGNGYCAEAQFPAKFWKCYFRRKRHEAALKSTTTSPSQYRTTFRKLSVCVRSFGVLHLQHALENGAQYRIPVQRPGPAR